MVQDTDFAEAEQLSFDFLDLNHDQTLIIQIVSMDALHGRRLGELISESRPDVAIDLRHVIRFDLPGTSREKVLQQFKSCKTEYVREPLPWHNLSRRDFISGEKVLSLRLEHEAVERELSSVMILVSKDEYARNVSAYLNRVLLERGARQSLILVSS